VAEKGVEFLRGAAYLPAAFLAANAYARHCRWPKPPPTIFSPSISICPWVFGVSVGRLGLEKSFIEKVCVCESG